MKGIPVSPRMLLEEETDEWPFLIGGGGGGGPAGVLEEDEEEGGGGGFGPRLGVSTELWTR